MSEHARCPCGTNLAVHRQHVGIQIGCPNCKRRLSVRMDSAGNVGVVPLNQVPVRQSIPQAQPPTTASRQQAHWDRKKKVDSNRTLVTGGIIAIGLVSLVVVAFGGMYALQRMNAGNNAAAKNPASQSSDLPAPVNLSSTSSPSLTSTSRDSDSNSETMALVDLIEIVEPTVVRLDVKSTEGDSIGSGVFVSDSGVIVTNFHVVQGAYEIKVTTSDGKSAISSGFYHADPMKDLASIQVDASNLNVVPIPFAKLLPRKGAEVAAFGSPMGFSFSATQGVVSSIRNGQEVQDALKLIVGIDVYSLLGYSIETDWIQMTASISGGNSGGPLVNMAGELVGINTWTNPAGQNLNFASTIEEVTTILDRTRDSKLKDFSALPRRRIEIQFENQPSQRRPREIAGKDGNSSRNMRQTPSGRKPGSTLGSNRNANEPNGDGSGSVKILTPEEIAAKDLEAKARIELAKKRSAESRAKMFGVEEIVSVTQPEAFSSDPAPNVSRSFDTQSGVIIDIAISPKEEYLATTSLEGTVCVFDFKSGKLLYRIKTK